MSNMINNSSQMMSINLGLTGFSAFTHEVEKNYTRGNILDYKPG